MEEDRFQALSKIMISPSLLHHLDRRHHRVIFQQQNDRCGIAPAHTRREGAHRLQTAGHNATGERRPLQALNQVVLPGKTRLYEGAKNLGTRLGSRTQHRGDVILELVEDAHLVHLLVLRDCRPGLRVAAKLFKSLPPQHLQHAIVICVRPTVFKITLSIVLHRWEGRGRGSNDAFGDDSPANSRGIGAGQGLRVGTDLFLLLALPLAAADHRRIRGRLNDMPGRHALVTATRVAHLPCV
mmetsp:Transcript_3037/g.9019  ORF Transcript_3037/g.9019 Transcript_3037/m.9019 type:complete len:240 (-) Transcript_3037:2442-3161(-)